MIDDSWKAPTKRSGYAHSDEPLLSDTGRRSKRVQQRCRPTPTAAARPTPSATNAPLAEAGSGDRQDHARAARGHGSGRQGQQGVGRELKRLAGPRRPRRRRTIARLAQEVVEMVPARHRPGCRQDRRQGRDLAEAGRFRRQAARLPGCRQALNAAPPAATSTRSRPATATSARPARRATTTYRPEMKH